MSLNVYGAIKLARTLAQKSGLTIQLEDEAHPRTDGRTLYLQRPSELWDRDKWVEWWGLFYHETGHNDPDMRDVFTLIHEKKINMDSFFGGGLNIIDDHRQEHHRIEEYYGRKMALSQSHAQILTRMLGNNIIGQEKQDLERQAMEAMFAFDTYCREKWMPTVSGMAEQFHRLLTPQSSQWYQELKDRFDEFDLKNINTAEDEYELWKKIINEVFKFDADEKEQEAKAEGAGEGSEGEGGEEQGKGSSAKDEGTGQDDAEGKGKRVKGTVNYDDLLKHKHGKNRAEAIYTPLHIEYGSPTNGAWEVRDPEVIDYRSRGTTSSSRRYESLINSLSSSGKGLANTVRRLLQIRSKAKRVYGQKSGKISARNLHRLNVKDAKDYSERVFTQKHENNILDVAVTVLGDGSGSMGGDKYAHMAQAAILLNEALGTLRVPMEMLTFSDGGGTQKIGIIKSFNEKVNRDRMTERFCDFSNHMSSNADGEAILFAYSRLHQQKQKRKILIVLSDGQPASWRGDADAHCREVVKQIEKSREVEIYGIGIMDDNVRRIYKDHDVISNPQELERALINVIKTKILS